MKKLFLAFVAIVSIGLAGAFANYTMTQGAGTTFGSVVVGGFHYVQMFVCDLTTPAQCQSVSAGGAAKVDGSAVTQPVSGTVTANAGTNLNTSTLATQTTVASIDTKTPALGQALAAASVPVILPSATITTLTPPSNTGYSTSANQTNGTQQSKITDGASIAAVKAANTVATTDIGLVVAVANTLAPGQAAAASSSPVVVAKNSGTGSTVAGAAVGTAGTPSAEVVSMQGVASGTPMPVSAPATGLPSTPGTLAGGATFVSGTTAAMTGTTSTSLIPLVSSQRIYVTRVKCNNSSSGTATLVQIRDGSAGTVLDTLAAGATYGGEQGTGSTPLFWTTAGTALFAQNVTTGASVICTASGYSG